MPLLNGERFIKTRPPSTLQPEDEVFFCPVTLEIFTDYNEYFERTILVNSATWYCAACGRGPTTYAEAVQCEVTDARQLNAYDSSLAAGLLHIIGSAKCRRLPELVELLCNFATNRFFIGEFVEFPLNK
ncbi:Bromodomain adjacent to zinc finger domain [Fasciolopsis buskii]|uniref:Bromodomain adjacent to zinc finger domain n=1 Tax=Fasciolopsis buskii TaxID=27845 RepID=A0A8E0S3W2_9TREM|nr:Bromodomain adjacent to zinc finger domain [Fasciolopsis buski]